jgi:hypothetical protein
MSDIEIWISDSMAFSAGIDRHFDFAKSEPVYGLRQRPGKHRRRTLYAGSRETWEAWWSICEGNASGALDNPAEMRASGKAADRIREALNRAEQQEKT